MASSKSFIKLRYFPDNLVIRTKLVSDCSLVPFCLSKTETNGKMGKQTEIDEEVYDLKIFTGLGFTTRVHQVISN